MIGVWFKRMVSVMGDRFCTVSVDTGLRERTQTIVSRLNGAVSCWTGKSWYTERNFFGFPVL